jgi:hypothetical protein
MRTAQTAGTTVSILSERLRQTMRLFMQKMLVAGIVFRKRKPTAVFLIDKIPHHCDEIAL